jgi:hypothetical protein
MNYSKVITTGLGFLLGLVVYHFVKKLGLVVYHFVKKALNGNGSVSVSEEETANAIGLKGLRRPGVLKVGTGMKPCWIQCQGGSCEDVCGNNGGTYQAGNNTCHYPIGHPTCNKRSPYIRR